MGFTKFTKNVLNISALPDRVQNQAEKLKATFDQAGVDIKEAHNTLIDELNADTSASNLGAKKADGTASTVQNVLNELDEFAKTSKEEVYNELNNKKVDKVAGKQLSTEDYTTTEKNKLASIAENANNYKLPVATTKALGGIIPDGVTITVDENGRASSITADSEDWTARQMVRDLEEDLTIEAVEVSGTEIEITDGSETESILHLNGNSEQDSRSGKNLYNYEDVSYKDTAITVDNDGWITATFDNTNGTSVKYAGYNTNNLELKEGTYYNVIVEIKNVSGGGYLRPVSAYEKVGQFDANYPLDFSNLANNTIVTKNVKTFSDLSGKTGGLRTEISFGTGKSGSITFRISVLEDTTVTADTFEYEAYGVQPSPDYPSEIRSVKSKSDNLLPNTGTTKTTYGITFTVNEDKTVTVNGTATNKATIELNVEERTFSAGTYTLSILESSSSDIKAGIKLGDNYYSTNTSRTITLSETTTFYKWYIDIASGVTVNNLVLKPMFNKGDKALPYTPYNTYVPVEVKVEGKNLFDKDNYNLVNFYPKTSGNGANNNYKSVYIPIKPNAIYTVYRNIFNNADVVIGTYTDMPVEASIPTVINLSSTNKPLSITSGANDRYLLAYINYGPTMLEDVLNNLQIVEGSYTAETMPPYEPYKCTTISVPLGDIELRSTPDGTRDTFERVDGVWNKKSEYNKIVLNGSENWLEATSIVTNSFRFYIDYAPKDIYPTSGKSNNEEYISSHFNSMSWGDIYAGNTDIENAICVYGETNRIVIRISKDYVTSLSDFKSWLTTHNVDVQYKLATPTYTPITDTALISALDELEQLILHKGYNRITTTAVNGVKAYLDLSYLKNNTGLEGTKEYVDRVEKRLTESIVSPGMILMWSGATNAVPRGWNLCDGTNGTPDLRDRFIVGAGNTYRVGDIGGSASVTLTVNQIPSHSHTMEEAGLHSHTYSKTEYDSENMYDTHLDDYPSDSNAQTSEDGLHTHIINAAGGGQSHENRPPYYALAYIMKL